MHALTIDALAGGGRVILGLGVSGPQIVEGWYGQPWGKPNAAAARLRDDPAQGRSTARSRSPTRARRSRCPTAARARSARASRCVRSCIPTARIPIWIAAGGAPQHRAGRRARRRLAADGPRPRRRSPTTRALLDRGLRQAPDGRPGDGASRCSAASPSTITDDVAGVLDAARAAHRDVRRRHGQRDPQLPPRRHGAARVPRGGRPHRRAVARRAQGGGGRGRPRRVPRADDAARARRSASASGGSAAWPRPGSPA